jgi:cobalt/nickel transport system permease protein
VNIHIDTLAYSNRLRHLPPVQKLGFALAVLCIALVSHYPVQIVILIWMSVWIVIYAGIPYQVYGAMLLGVSLFLITSLPALVFEYVDRISADLQLDVLWQLRVGNGYIYLSHNGLMRAISVVIRSLATTSALFSIVLTIPAIELASTCQKMGFPPILIELSLLVYRFIFLLAQISRGGYRTPQLRMNSLNLLVRQLLQRTASRYQQLTLGVKARGFEQEFRFWQPQAYQYSQRFGIESIVGCLLLVIGEILYRVL